MMKRKRAFLSIGLSLGLTALLTICAPPAMGMGAIHVLAFSNDGAGGEVARLNGIGGIVAEGTADLADITADNLANYDVFYAASEFEILLDPKASVLQNFVLGGRGLVIGQANVAGPIAWLPGGLAASVDSISHPGNAHCDPTPSGLVHPILDGLGEADFGATPSDTVFRSDLAPGWDVLLVHSSDPDIIDMAVGVYGNGRTILWPDRYDTSVEGGALPSDQFIRQAYEWVAVPGPATLGLLALGGIAMLRRRK